MADEKVKENSKKENSKKDKEKKRKEPNKVARWFKDFFAELKKVTWPTFSKVVKQTGVVLMVTVCFLLVLMAFDSLFGWLYDLLVGGLTNDGVTAALAAALRVGTGGLL